jgi:hypothetical protein
MTEFISTLGLVLLAVGAAEYYLYARRRSRRERIARILSGSNILARWSYAPDEWRKAADEEFTWVRNKNSGGEVCISPTTIYIKSDTQDRLIDLSGDGKIVTHASYRGLDMGPLKFRVRWKVVRRDPDRSDEVKYYKEDYRVPVPITYREDAERVVAYFTARLENNLEAYAAVVPDDEPISLFGKDPF